MIAVGSANDPNTSQDRLGYRDYTGKTPVYPGLTGGENTGIFIAAGQSLLENSVAGFYTPTNPKVHALSYDNGGMYFAQDPLPGAQGANGCMLGRLGDKLIDGGVFQRVIFAPCAVDGSTIARWDVTGDLYWRWAVIKSRMTALGLTPTAIIWEQGTANTTVGVTQADWTAPFNSMMVGVRSLWPTVPMIVALSTIPGYAAHVPSQTIRAAQVAVRNPGNFIFPGPDTDTDVPAADRYDGIHDSAVGADKRAATWKLTLDAYF